MAVAVAVALLAGVGILPATAFHDGGLILLNSHSYTWTDPESGGMVEFTENVYEGCLLPTGEFLPHDMTFEYIVLNLSYDPIPGITNGFSGFQILFPQQVPEVHNQISPAIGGPWQQNAFSGQFPPWGVEWDVPLPDMGIMPGQTGTFSYCTFEREDVMAEPVDSGWVHTWGVPYEEPIIDADGSASRFDGVPGAVEVSIGDTLTSWPTGRWQEGLDGFDTDGNDIWTPGDDLHVEDPTTHPGAIRDGTHDDGLDPLVLDLDDSLNTTPGNEPVSCDFETGTFCQAGYLVPLKFFDTSGNGFWDDGEDIVWDLNGDGVFGGVDNIQSFMFYGPQSVPGRLLHVLETDACSAGHEICKKVKYLDEDYDGVIEVGEPVSFLEVIQVHNPTGDTWSDVNVKDRWGAEIAVDSAVASVGTVELATVGKSAKFFLQWEIGDLGPGETANLVLGTRTDLNPAGHQTYSEPGEYEYNSGAVLKFHAPKQASFETGQVMVSVLPEN
jgi:hypothetical protein